MSDIVKRQVEEIVYDKVEEEKTQEPVDDVKEIVTNEVVVEIVKETFSQMLENYLNQNKDKLETLSVKVTPEMQKYFLLLCKDKSGFFYDIETTLKKIILDDKIDTKDIPEILVLVTNVYAIVKKDKSVPKVDPYELIKSLLNVVFIIYIETNKVQNKELVTDLLKIIDVSIDLIKIKAIKPPKVGCFSKLFK
jgi:hypothetical protein